MLNKPLLTVGSIFSVFFGCVLIVSSFLFLYVGDSSSLGGSKTF